MVRCWTVLARLWPLLKPALEQGHRQIAMRRVDFASPLQCAIAASAQLIDCMNRSPAGLELPPPPAQLARLSQRLGERIAAEILRDGPMPFDRYMAMALYEPGL